MTDNYVWKPTAEIVDHSNIGRFMRRHRIAGYRELVAQSTSDIEWFWRAAVEDLEIEFFRPFERVLDSSRGIAWTTWFGGGTINLAHQCVDRHAQSGRRDETAVIAEGEDGVSRRLSYAELYAETCRLANALEELGIGQGDAIGLFLPMIPEAVIGFLACAKIGAIAVPIFSGFGAQAVAARLADCSVEGCAHRATRARGAGMRSIWKALHSRRPRRAPAFVMSSSPAVGRAGLRPSGLPGLGRAGAGSGAGADVGGA